MVSASLNISSTAVAQHYRGKARSTSGIARAVERICILELWQHASSIASRASCKYIDGGRHHLEHSLQVDVMSIGTSRGANPVHEPSFFWGKSYDAMLPLDLGKLVKLK